MKLHNNKANNVLIDISGQLAYNNSMVEKLKEEVVGDTEVLQEETVDIALYMSNYYLNEREENMDTSQLQDQRDFFNDQGKELITAYYNNQLPAIHFKDEHLKDYLTVGDIRLSQYDDGTPILNVQNYGENGTYKALNGIMEIYINQEDLDTVRYGETIDSSIEEEPARKELNMKAITF